MNKRLAIGILVAVIASAVTSGTVLVIGQGRGDPPKIPASKALKPSEVTKLPQGTPAKELALPYDYGRFRIVPPGGTYNYCDATPPGRTRVKQVTKILPRPDAAMPQSVLNGPEGDLLVIQSLDELRNHALFVEPPYIPAGWKLANAEAFSITWDDGSQLDSFFFLNYEQPGYFYINITRFLIGPNCQLEMTDYGRRLGFRHALTLSEIRGVPVVILHQAPGEKIQATLQVNFIIDNVVTTVESVAIDLDELIQIANALIAQTQAARP